MKLKQGWPLFLTLVLVSCGGSKQDPPPSDLLRDGWTRYDEGDHGGALTLFEKAFLGATDDTTRAESKVGAGWALHRLGRHDEAVAAFDAALLLVSGHAWAMAGKGGALLSRASAGDAAEALSLFTTLADAHPDFSFPHQPILDMADVYAMKGQAALLVENYDLAWEAVFKALEINSNHALANQLLVTLEELTLS